MRYAIVALAVLLPAPAAAQVAITPDAVAPAAWQRFAIRVINQTDTATVAVRVEVPQVVMILGVEAKPGWKVETIPAKDSTAPQAISWTGGSVTKGQFDEFAFLGRLDPNAKKEELGFPVQIQRATGSLVEWRRPAGEPYETPRVAIVGTASLSNTGAVTLAGAALGVALIAVVFAIAFGTRKR